MYRYTYRPTTGQLKIKIATQIHSRALMWAAYLRAEGGAVGGWGRKDIDLSSKGHLPCFTAKYEGVQNVNARGTIYSMWIILRKCKGSCEARWVRSIEQIW